MFGLSLACYDLTFFIFLLRHFICMEAIQTSKADSISLIYHIMIVDMLKNWSRGYSSYYILRKRLVNIIERVEVYIYTNTRARH